MTSFSVHLRIFIPLIFLSVGTLCRALTIDGYSSSANDRFANQAGFIASAFNLSGVAISNDGRWATLIAPNVFVTANHFPPGVGQTLTFYKTNDPTGPSITRTVASTRQRVGTSDYLICTLDLPIPENYTYYVRATESMASTYSWYTYPYRNKELYHFGRSPGNYATNQDIAIGKNVLDRKEQNVAIESPAGSGPAIECVQQTGNSKVLYETMAQGGDSGAPIFYNYNGILKLVGISWYITTRPSTGFTPVGEYNNATNSFLTTNALPYQPLTPSAFAGTRISATRIDLSWQDNSGVETAYLLERAESADGPWTPLATLSADVESYSDTTAPAGDVHYRLHAANDTDSHLVLAAVLTPYGLWATGFDWGSEDQSPTGDANHDGLANLVAYGLDLNPIDPVPADAQPYLEVSPSTLDYFYRRNDEATDLSYTLKRCTDLLNQDWQTIVIDGTTITETDMGSVDSARLIRIRMPGSSVTTTGLFRLQIETDTPP